MSVVGRQVVRPVFAVYEHVVQVCNFSIIIPSSAICFVFRFRRFRFFR